MSKVKLTKIDVERWRFVLYKTPDETWVARFSYSPKSFVDLSMFIELNNEEKKNGETNRQYLIDFADNVRNNYEEYIVRALNSDNYLFD